jgi:hypothetical protein
MPQENRKVKRKKVATGQDCSLLRQASSPFLFKRPLSCKRRSLMNPVYHTIFEIVKIESRSLTPEKGNFPIAVV